MSFSVDFVATVAEAEKVVGQEYLPSEVRLFLIQGLRAYPADSLVRVKAVGHLFNKDYQRSNAELLVEQVLLRVAKAT